MMLVVEGKRPGQRPRGLALAGNEGRQKKDSAPTDPHAKRSKVGAQVEEDSA
jgi:hypothetical protein